MPIYSYPSDLQWYKYLLWLFLASLASLLIAWFYFPDINSYFLYSILIPMGTITLILWARISAIVYRHNHVSTVLYVYGFTEEVIVQDFSVEDNRLNMVKHSGLKFHLSNNYVIKSNLSEELILYHYKFPAKYSNQDFIVVLDLSQISTNSPVRVFQKSVTPHLS